MELLLIDLYIEPLKLRNTLNKWWKSIGEKNQKEIKDFIIKDDDDHHLKIFYLWSEEDRREYLDKFVRIYCPDF